MHRLRLASDDLSEEHRRALILQWIKDSYDQEFG